MNRAKLSRAASIVVRSSEWLALAFLVIASIPSLLIRHTSLTIVPVLDLLDGSWLLDTSFKAAGGIWFGRDVAFTYGPLFQWLSSAPARWIGLSMGSIYATWYTLPTLILIIATFLTARLLLPEAGAWKRGLLVLLAVIFWSAPDVRSSLCVLAFAIFIRLTDVAASGARRIAICAAASAAICIAAFLLSADTGIYTSAALLLTVAATTLAHPRPARMARFLGIAALMFGALMLLTNTVNASPLDFRLWRWGLGIVHGYRWFEATSMLKADKRLVVATFALGIAIFAAAWWQRQPAGRWTRRPAFLIAGFGVGFLMMQSALVRSDHIHVRFGVFGMLFLCGTIAFDAFDSRWLSLTAPAAAIIASVALASAYPLYRPAAVVEQWRQIRHPLLSCPAGMAQFDHACFAPADADLLDKVSGFVRLHAGPGDKIAIFPYQTTFGVASRRQVAGGVLQSYLVNGEYLSGLEVAGLRRSNPPVTLYLPDGVASAPIDFVPNFTRSPEVWFYLLRHYRAEGSPAPGVLGLIRDDAREARLSFVQEPMVSAGSRVLVRKRHASVELPIRRVEAGADFLKLRLQVTYPLWWRIRKPSKLALQLSFDNGTEKTIAFVLQPNRTTDVWMYPWDEKEMGSYFAADRSAWPSGKRPNIVGLTLLVAPYDWLSVAPNSVTIEGVQAVRLEMR